ncbi:phage tail protein [Actinomyces minihominis]|uniref:phage tail protein n=1 Tax=Actinomyces minihominis TaxID=2002838 RepID=UPI000C0690F1|nr:phage tail protein [Actinomyces minihominis]
MRSFTINDNVNSERDLGLRITRPPVLPASQRVVEHLEVLGREGTLTRVQGWEDQELSFQAAVQGQDLIGQYRKATAALIAAKTLELSTSPGVFYQVKTVMVGGLQQLFAGFAVFEIQMRLAPFAYLLDVPVVEFTGQKTLLNVGTAYSQPVITLEGTGTHTLTVNGQVFSIKSPAGLLTIDSALRVCRVGSKAGADAITPDYPELRTGSNTVKVSAGVTKAILEPNWRML